MFQIKHSRCLKPLNKQKDKATLRNPNQHKNPLISRVSVIRQKIDKLLLIHKKTKSLFSLMNGRVTVRITTNLRVKLKVTNRATTEVMMKVQKKAMMKANRVLSLRHSKQSVQIQIQIATMKRNTMTIKSIIQKRQIPTTNLNLKNDHFVIK